MRTEEKKFLFRKRFGTGTQGSFGDCSCGITSYDVANKWDSDHDEILGGLEEGETVQLQSNAIELIDINGYLFVVGCRCKTDEMLFQMLNEHRSQVVRYLKDTQDVDVRDL